MGIESVTEVTEIAVTPDGPAPGTLLVGKYRVEATLGVGGYGRVIRAHHLVLDEPVAIKLLRDDVQLDADNIHRFIREAQAASRLKSEHVAEIRDVGELGGGRPYIVMELLDGIDLARLVERDGPLDVAIAADLMLQACHALAEAHAMGIVHRDIKPANLFLASRPDGSRVLKVLDFGIAKAPNSAGLKLTQTQSVLGTPMYMSPEQSRSARTVDARSDVWSLGTVLYELVEGSPPFLAESFAELCVKIATEPPPPMKRAPQLAPIIERCLEKVPAKRYPTIADLATDLAAFGSEPHASTYLQRICGVLGMPRRAPSSPSIVHARSLSLPASPKRSRARIWIPALLGAAGAAAIIAIAVGRGSGRAAEPEHAPSPAASTTAPSAPPPVVALAPEPPPAPTNVTLVVDSVPAGAEVYRASDGVKLGKTPLQRTYQRTDGEAEFLIKLPGYADARVSLSTQRDGSTVARLVHEKRSPVAHPAAAAKPVEPKPKPRGPTLLDPYGAKKQ